MTGPAVNPLSANRWVQAWPDALAFAGGLAVAWFAGWNTTDLVWSLWLSSLVVGYAMIVWSLLGPVLFIGTQAWGERPMNGSGAKGGTTLAAGGMLVFALFMLAFFTVHFGMFHFVHSMFLNMFFPVQPGPVKPLAGYGLYLEVFRRYWWFLPAAAIAERAAFRLQPPEPAVSDMAVTSDAIAARKARNARKSGFTGMMAPYKNVIRLHLLIFFFAAAHFARLDNFLVYAVVYAVYFFPWRLVKQEAVSM